MKNLKILNTMSKVVRDPKMDITTFLKVYYLKLIIFSPIFYFFQDKRIWVYDDELKLKNGFPIDVTLDEYSYPSEVDAAIIENNEMFLFWVLIIHSVILLFIIS